MRAIELTHDAVRGLLESNAAYRAGMARLWKETAEEARRADAKERVTASIDRHLAALEDRAVLHTMGGGGSLAGASPPNHLDVFGPPYADHWSDVEL